MKSVVIIGSGNVAESLAAGMPRKGFAVVQIFARNEERGRRLAQMAGCQWCCDAQRMAAADLYVTCVSDRAIEQVLAPLDLPEGAIVVHTSGARPIEAVPAKFSRRGVLYPLMTFTAGRTVELGTLPWFIEGSDSETVEALRSVVQSFGSGATACETSSEQRARIHLAGVLACNFTNAMIAAGCDVMRSCGLRGEWLRPLVGETVEKAFDPQMHGDNTDADPHRVQTGPAVRGDEVTMQRHRQLIDDPLLAEIYDKISRYIYERKL